MRFTKFEDMLPHLQRNQVVKCSRDSGKSWYYVKIRKPVPGEFAYSLTDIKEGIDAAGRLRHGGTAHKVPIINEDFKNPDFIVETTTEEEIQGMKFSYD